MSIRNALIRIAANCIYFLRRKTLRGSGIRFLVFSGTSGKTLARTASVHVLRRAALPVVSPPFGYTNELGIVLAALGIESVRLFSLSGIRRVASARAPRGAYICIELGADWRADIDWFLDRFVPFGVCITNVASLEWTRTREEIWSDKRALMENIPSEGFLVWSRENESVEQIRGIASKLRCRRAEFSVSIGKQYVTYKNRRFHSALAEFVPYAQAFGAAIASIECIGSPASVRDDAFADYAPPAGRLVQKRLPGGAILLADTYKAVPQCTLHVLATALAISAKKRIAVITAMQPLWKNERDHYRQIGELLNHFDGSYFVGPERLFSMLRQIVPHAIHADIGTLGILLKKEATDGTLIVIKGAGRYHLDRLASLLDANEHVRRGL